MISGDLRFEGFDAKSWTSLVALFSRGVADRVSQGVAEGEDPIFDLAERAGDRRGSLVVVVDDEHRVLKSHHTLRGRVTDLRYEHPGQLPDLCKQYGARRAWVMRAGAAEELAERLAMHHRRGSDYLDQVLVTLRCARELEDAGMFRVWPNPWRKVPIPTAAMVRRAFDLAIPNGHSAVLALWEKGRLDTCVAARRSAAGVDRIAGPDMIRRWAGPLGGDWRRDYMVLNHAVSRAMAPVHLGVFGERHTVERLLRAPDPGAWATAVTVRDVIIRPSPGFTTLAVGADAIRGVADASRKMLGGVDLLGLMRPLGHMVRSRLPGAAGIEDALGFNPLTVLAESLRNQPADQDDTPENG